MIAQLMLATVSYFDMNGMVTALHWNEVNISFTASS